MVRVSGICSIGDEMKNTLELIEKLKSQCPPILGTNADIVIRPGNRDGLIIEAHWYCAETYGFCRAYTSAEIKNVSNDSILVDSFIYECERQAAAVES